MLSKQKKVTKLTSKLIQARQKKEMDVLLKKKNQLDMQLYKKKYERVIKYLSAVSSGDAKMNPFKASHKPSVFSESYEDPKLQIRANAELFENVIKTSQKAFTNKEIQAKFKHMTED